MGLFSCFACKTTDDQSIKVLDYSRAQLNEVPSNVFNYERTLEVLLLDGNKIFDLPRLLFQCEELKVLNLSDNEIRNIPELIAKLSHLEVLNLHRNYLTHTSIPHDIFKCQNLNCLDLSSNSLDKIPEGLTTLANLNQLYLNDTYIEYLPASFGRLSNLTILELRDNCLTLLPKSMKRLTSLQRLDISNNDFTDWPEVIGDLTGLIELWINGNCIQVILENISNLSKLEQLDVSNNDLCELTHKIHLCTSLNMLLLSNNFLKDLPDSVGNLANLETLKLDHNQIRALPATISKLAKLEELDVQYNQLSGVPSVVGRLRKLNYLILSHNLISALPQEIGSCVELRTLNLHFNHLSDLPDEIGHLENLTSLGLIGNNLRHLPLSVFNLRKLRALWLSENQSQPLISLQKEVFSSGHIALTCIFLPQSQQLASKELSCSHNPPTERHIYFSDNNTSKTLSVRLSRSPTPYPKDFHRYQHSLAHILKRNKESSAQNVNGDNVDSNLTPVVIKQAKVKPMKVNAQENCHDCPRDDKSSKIETDFVPSSQEPPPAETGPPPDPAEDGKPLNSSNNDLEHKSTPDYSNLRILNASYNKPAQPVPPPYSIAKMYSKTAHLYNSTPSTGRSKEAAGGEEQPKMFTQDQPVNILTPQPQHPFRMLDCEGNKVALGLPETYDNTHSASYGLVQKQSGAKGPPKAIGDTLNNFESNTASRPLCVQSKCRPHPAQNHLNSNDDAQSAPFNWIFGPHRNRRIVEVQLTPCCYVLGFTIKCNEHGVFVDEIDKNGNAFKKLYTGDKILMVDDKDITGLLPEEGERMVHLLGPEAEIIVVSRI